jgi:hypothetical protein
MKKIFLLTAVLAVVFIMGDIQRVSAQYYYYDDYTYDTPLTFEAGVSVGAMNSLTDIGGNAGEAKKGVHDLYLGDGYTHPCGSIYIAGVYKYAYGLRLEATYGGISAADSTLKAVAGSSGGRYQRNLSFRSRIAELSLVAEFYPLYIFVDWANTKYNAPKLSPYILAGVGVFHFNPQARGDTAAGTGGWIDLQPLHTEGEGFSQYPGRNNYSLTQLNFPVGVGLKYEISDKINIRAELMWRILKTDYLDDVSSTYVDPKYFAANFSNPTQVQEAEFFSDRVKNSPATPQYNWHVGGIRGDSKNNDTYFSFNIKVGIAFGRERR